MPTMLHAELPELVPGGSNRRPLGMVLADAFACNGLQLELLPAAYLHDDDGLLAWHAICMTGLTCTNMQSTTFWRPIDLSLQRHVCMNSQYTRPVKAPSMHAGAPGISNANVVQIHTCAHTCHM